MASDWGTEGGPQGMLGLVSGVPPKDSGFLCVYRLCFPAFRENLSSWEENLALAACISGDGKLCVQQVPGTL